MGSRRFSSSPQVQTGHPSASRAAIHSRRQSLELFLSLWCCVRDAVRAVCPIREDIRSLRSELNCAELKVREMFNVSDGPRIPRSTDQSLLDSGSCTDVLRHPVPPLDDRSGPLLIFFSKLRAMRALPFGVARMLTRGWVCCAENSSAYTLPR
jgi:hypothetical protein